jgi:Family of unknown function (DUF5681)
MNFVPPDGDKGAPGTDTQGDYEVGYKKPPVQYRFKKGRSGNPLGRPAKSKPLRGPQSLASRNQPANKFLMEEAYRPVLVREGDRTIELPAIQAVFRAMGVAAMKGNRFAQRTLAELVQAVEAEDRQAQLDHLKTLIDYKCNWEEAIEEARLCGRSIPDPVPHPDDVILDFIEGRATVCGPLTKEDKVRWDRLLQYRDELQSEVSRFAKTYRRARSEVSKADALDMWKHKQKYYDQTNDNLPQRYRKILEDRCWEAGASLPGQQRKRKWPGDD